VPQGKSVSFLIDSQIERNENNDAIDIVQVISSDIDGQYRPVVGGYRNQDGHNRLSAKFKLAGDYFFKLLNHPKNPPICKVTIKEEDTLTFIITDNGFMPRVIRIEEHTTIKWQWSQVSFPHSIYEAEYCASHNGLFRTTKELATKALTNSYKRTFKESGLYYFQTDSKNPDVKHMCLVEVHQSFRDRGIEILDSKFSPARLTIEEGDRVFFHWNKENVRRPFQHCHIFV
jgi:plastocyanin